MRKFLAILAASMLFLAACGDDDDTESTDTTTAPSTAAPTTAAPDVEEALANFCDEGQVYIDALDTFGMVFTDEEPTVGDLSEGLDPLVELGDQAKEAGEALAAAIEEQDKEIEEAIAAGETPPSTVVTVDVPDDLVARTIEAQDALVAAIEGIDLDTPLSEAGIAVTSAAYAVEVNWIDVLIEAGCSEDPNAARAQIQQLIAGAQQDLTTAGYYTGPIDGVYGPAMADAIKALQAEVELPETGYLDPPTQEALQDALEGQASAQVSALQGVLKTLGYWDGEIDGQWTPELETALKTFQADLGVEQTGQLDEATLRALQQALADAEAAANATTTTAPPTTAAPATTEAPATTVAPTTSTP